VRRAGRARQVAGTALNAHSSRSHAVYSLKLIRSGGGEDEAGADANSAAAAQESGAAAATAAAPARASAGGRSGGRGAAGRQAPAARGGAGSCGGGGDDDGEDASYLHFVDLAGCERVARTGNSGARLRCGRQAGGAGVAATMRRRASRRGLILQACSSPRALRWSKPSCPQPSPPPHRPGSLSLSTRRS
jgi:hypothetical protein